MPTKDGIDKPRAENIMTHEDMKYESPSWTICEILREIYWIAYREGNTEITERCLLAVTVTKKMTEKMKEYKEKYEPEGEAKHPWKDAYEEVGV